MVAASSVQEKDKNGGQIRFPVPLPSLVANLLIFEGRGG